MPNFNVLNRLDEGFAQFNALNRLRVLPLFNALNDCGFSEGFAGRRGLPKRYKYIKIFEVLNETNPFLKTSK